MKGSIKAKRDSLEHLKEMRNEMVAEAKRDKANLLEGFRKACEKAASIADQVISESRKKLEDRLTISSADMSKRVAKITEPIWAAYNAYAEEVEDVLRIRFEAIEEAYRLALKVLKDVEKAGVIMPQEWGDIPSDVKIP